MVDFVKNKSWAATETIEDNVDAGATGKVGGGVSNWDASSVSQMIHGSTN